MNADQFDVTLRVAGARKRRATEGETPVDEDGLVDGKFEGH